MMLMTLDIRPAKAILLFYLTSFGNEELAKSASLETYKKYKKMSKKSNLLKKNRPSVIVHTTHKIWEKYKKKIDENFFSNSRSWDISENPEVWKNFYKKASESEFLILIWSKVLNFSEKQIALGLNLTEETVRYRTGRALKLLGKMNKK